MYVAVCTATEDVLRHGGPHRTYNESDANVFEEDLSQLERWFVARDEDGVVQGLAQELVEELTLPLINIVNYTQFKAPTNAKDRQTTGNSPVGPL